MESKVEVYHAPLTSEESVAIGKFKELLKTKKVEYDSVKFDDSYLIRFLRGRKLDLNKTYEMFTNFLKWRKENNVDESEKFVYHELDQVKVNYPHGHHKTDKQGMPIYIEVIGELKLDQLFKITTTDRLLSYQIKCYEKLINQILPACSQAANKHISQSLTIIDLKKMTMKLLNKKVYNFLKLTSSNFQNYYPEILGQLYVTNAGLLFKTAWAVCKAFLDEKTKKKIITLGSDYKKKLLEQIDVQNLPKFLGGECTCEPYGCIYSNAGPWNTEGKVEINPELLKEKVKDAVEDNEELDQPEEHAVAAEDIDEDDRERLSELSKQLNEQMNLSKGQKENAQFKMESNQDQDFGDTPLNTQEGDFDPNDK